MLIVMGDIVTGAIRRITFTQLRCGIAQRVARSIKLAASVVAFIASRRNCPLSNTGRRTPISTPRFTSLVLLALSKIVLRFIVSSISVKLVASVNLAASRRYPARLAPCGHRGDVQSRP